MSRWFRHYAGMMRDDKLVRVAIRSGQTIERVVWVYAAILESAAEIDDEGRYDFDAAEAAYFLRADESDIGNILNELEVSARCASGRVVKWDNRQFTSDRSAERQRAYRQRKRQSDLPSDAGKPLRDAKVTSLSRHGDAPETELETETEVSEAKASSVCAPVIFEEKRQAIASCLRIAFPCPAGVSAEQWAAFRQQRKKPLNARSYALVCNKLVSLAEAGWPPGDMIDLAIERGWETVFEPRENRYERRSDSNPTATAAARVAAAIRCRGANG